MTTGTRRTMGGADAMWLHADRPNHLMVIDGIMWTEQPLDWAAPRGDHPGAAGRHLPGLPPAPGRPGPPLGPARAGRTTPTSACPTTSTTPSCAGRAAPPSCAPSSSRRSAGPWTAAGRCGRRGSIDGYGEGSVVFTRLHHAMADGMALAAGDADAHRPVARRPSGPGAPRSPAGTVPRLVGHGTGAQHPEPAAGPGHGAPGPRGHPQAPARRPARDPAEPRPRRGQAAGLVAAPPARRGQGHRPQHREHRQRRAHRRALGCARALPGLLRRGGRPPHDHGPGQHPAPWTSRCPASSATSSPWSCSTCPRPRCRCCERLDEVHRRMAHIKQSPEVFITSAMAEGIGHLHAIEQAARRLLRRQGHRRHHQRDGPDASPATSRGSRSPGSSAGCPGRGGRRWACASSAMPTPSGSASRSTPPRCRTPSS